MNLVQFTSPFGDVITINPGMIFAIHSQESGVVIELSTGRSIPVNESFTDVVARLRPALIFETKG